MPCCHPKVEFKDEFGIMMLWLVLALMTAAAMLVVAWPLARMGRKPRSGSDLVVYRDQLDEIRRDRTAGRASCQFDVRGKESF